MSKPIKIRKIVQEKVCFELFGKTWNYGGSLSSLKKLKEEDFKEMMMESLIEAEYDDKNNEIILFYTKGRPGFKNFSFAVLMDNKMKEITSGKYLEDVHNELVTHIFDNRDTLNFNV